MGVHDGGSSSGSEVPVVPSKREGGRIMNFHPWIIRIGCMLLLGVLISCSDSSSEPIRTAAAQADPAASEPSDGSVLPFPPPPSASVAKRTMQESTHHRRKEPRRLPADAPNVLIVLLDDVGPGL